MCDGVFIFFVSYLHKMGDEGDQLMEKILPTLSDFCVYVQQ